MAALDPGVDSERLGRRLDFLQSRANAHLEIQGESPASRACAATLLRDAACVALMLQRIADAKRLFRDAGDHLLKLGMPTGFVLLALADGPAARERISNYGDVIDAFKGADHRNREAWKARPMLRQALSSPRQLLSFLQADWMMRALDLQPLIDGESHVRRMLEHHGGYPAGTSGVSIDTYLDVGETFSRGEIEGERMPQKAQLALTTMAVSRQEQIRAAMRDAYHWRMLPKPAELLDLDVTVLSMLALKRGFPFEVLHAMFQHDVPFAAAPIDAALVLSRGQGFATA